MGASAAELAGLQILVVEDNDNARALLRDFFTYFGAQVAVAASARDGLRRLRDLRPDVVVADMRLRDQNASWLLREARTIPCEAPFIAVTAYDFDEKKLRSQGFVNVLRKPLGRTNLVTAVVAATQRR